MKIAKLGVCAAFIFSAAYFARPALAGQPTALSELPAFTSTGVISSVNDLKFPEPSAKAAAPRCGLPPVVITVPGLKYSKLDIKALAVPILRDLFESVFKKQKLTDRKSFEASFQEYLSQNEASFGEDAAAGAVRELPDNYLEARLQQMPEYASNAFTIVPFPWSRDPDDSAAVVPGFVGKLAQVYDTYKDSGRPIYILAHSWGSLLMHEAMHRLEKTRPDVRIDRFITTGSPLTPAYEVIRSYVSVESKNEGLITAVSKPSIVREWVNIWSSRDILSNAIKAADSNTQTDASVENLEPKLIRIILTKPSESIQAGKDLTKLRNFIPWHKSYMYDFNASIDTLKKTVSVTVFLPIVAPEIIKARPPR